jgi:DNA-binding transcriptional regulator YiaG
MDANTKRLLQGLGPSSNTKLLLEKMAELQARLDAEKIHDKQRAQLVAFVAKRPYLTTDDLKAVAKSMGRDRGTGVPVATKAKRGNILLGAHMLKPAKGKVGKAIRAARLKAQLSDDEVGQKIGISGATVSAWQKGKNVTPRLRDRLTEVLSLPKGLLNGTGSVASK